MDPVRYPGATRSSRAWGSSPHVAGFSEPACDRNGPVRSFRSVRLNPLPAFSGTQDRDRRSEYAAACNQCQISGIFTMLRHRKQRLMAPLNHAGTFLLSASRCTAILGGFVAIVQDFKDYVRKRGVAGRLWRRLSRRGDGPMAELSWRGTVAGKSSAVWWKALPEFLRSEATNRDKWSL